jgi:hypothetical protein
VNNEERLRVLRMVAAGKLSPADAEELLDELEPVDRRETAATPVQFQEVSHVARSTSPRSLTIRIIENGQSKVDVRIPFALAQAAGAFLPGKAQRYLSEYGVKLDDVLSKLGTMHASGSIIHVQEGESLVDIAVV